MCRRQSNTNKKLGNIKQRVNKIATKEYSTYTPPTYKHPHVVCLLRCDRGVGCEERHFCLAKKISYVGIARRLLCVPTILVGQE